MSTPEAAHKKDAIDAITVAFPAVPLDPTFAFVGRGETSLDADSFAAEVRGKTWPALDAQFLERHREVPFFLAASAFADYLPAFLATAIEHYEELDLLPQFLLSALRRPSEPPAEVARFDAWADRLTLPQARAVAASVATLESLYGAAGNNPRTHVLDAYWRDRVAARAQSQI